MPRGRDVKHESKWSDVLNIFDDGYFSAIWGHYDGSPRRRLGIRWNGDNGTENFPLSFGNPVWMVVPDILSRAVLHELSHLKQNSGDPKEDDKNKENIEIALHAS